MPPTEFRSLAALPERERGATRVEFDRERRLKLGGGLAAIAIAAVVYSQFSLYGWMKRDSAIYIYGGEQMLHGVPPYASIMDPKGPLAGILCGLGTGVARLFGRDDLLVIRVEFCGISILTVLAVYLLVVSLWQSVVAGLVAAVVFASFEGFARDALAGPNGHTPGILFLVFALWLTARRDWYWAGFTGMLAFLVWQPLFPYPIVTVICAVVWSSPQRRLRTAGRSLAGAASPFLALVVYYAGEGYFGKLFEGLFWFPLRGVTRNSVTLGQRVHLIFWDVRNQYGISGNLLWAGLLLLLVVAVGLVAAAPAGRRRALAAPVDLLVGLTLLAEVMYALYDYQGYSHAFPLLPYAAIGFGGATAYLLRRLTQPRIRQVATAALLIGVTVVTLGFALAYAQPSQKNPPLRAEQASACAIQRSLLPGTPLWTLGNPLPLAMLHRRNPDNYPYLGSGLDEWKIKHTAAGFHGWTAQITASRASVIVIDVWHSPIKHRMQQWLTTNGYEHGFIGPWQVAVTPQARANMSVAGIALTNTARFWPRTSAHTRFTITHCTR